LKNSAERGQQLCDERQHTGRGLGLGAALDDPPSTTTRVISMLIVCASTSTSVQRNP
jgi:hypothetical protein